MQSNISYESLYGEYSQQYQNMSGSYQELPSTNRFIYIKQHVAEKSSHNSTNGSQTVLVNPHFKQNKVFVNPKFSGIQRIHSNTIHVNPRLKNLNALNLNNTSFLKSQPLQENIPVQSTKIHINPHAKSDQISLNTNLMISQSTLQTVHINPNFKNPTISNNIPLNNTVNVSHVTKEKILPFVPVNRAVVLTRTKLIRTSTVNNENKRMKRRNSVKSKYKIVKSSLQSLPKTTTGSSFEQNKSINRYKIDRRRRKSLSIIAKHQKKYVYVNKFISISELAKTRVIKSPVKSTAFVNISGVVYRKSKMSLRRTSIPSLSTKKSPSRIVRMSKYKLVKQPALKKNITCKSVLQNKSSFCDNAVMLKKFKIIRKPNPKKNKVAKTSPKILKKCNIPCPYYKKYGLCKGNENGKCFRKHDPDQIALCTRFLQGACIKEKCLLSHNVSPEKMPTCKYYLEGSCSKEDCPYLHVKINPKAEVCRDFLEGFCKKAAECDKRHQYLCPDFEKYGNCLKQRCPYPHGIMVRNYLSNKSKFAKKRSDSDKKITRKDHKSVVTSTLKCIDTNVCKNEQVLMEKQRYYKEKTPETEETAAIQPSTSNKQEDPENNEEKSKTKNFIGLRSRPKLGALPAFIPFGK